jgi:2-phospho-L-lactate guanylyltransferase
VPAAVVPIRSVADAKRRLAPRLDPAARHDLARALAVGVVGTLAGPAGLETFVVTADVEVAELARAAGALVLDDSRGTLDDAAATGVARARSGGHERVVIAHSDLPFPADLVGLVEVGPADGIVLVPDRHGDGTNVVVLPCELEFGFAYGPGSFARHQAEAEGSGRPVTVVSPSPLGWDVDVPEDLDPPAAWGAPSWTGSVGTMRG